MSTVIRYGFYVPILRVSLTAELETSTFIYTSYMDAKAHTVAGDYIAWVRWNSRGNLTMCCFIDDMLAEVYCGKIDSGESVLSSVASPSPAPYNVTDLPTYDPVSFIQR